MIIALLIAILLVLLIGPRGFGILLLILAKMAAHLFVGACILGAIAFAPSVMSRKRFWPYVTFVTLLESRL